MIWGHASDEVVRAAEEDLASVRDELKNNQTERWQAVGMLKHILAPVTLPWELKKHALNFLLCITDGNVPHYDEHDDFSSYMSSIFAALQVAPCHHYLLQEFHIYQRGKESNLFFFNLLWAWYILGCANGHHICIRYSAPEECL